MTWADSVVMDAVRYRLCDVGGQSGVEQSKNASQTVGARFLVVGKRSDR